MEDNHTSDSLLIIPLKEGFLLAKPKYEKWLTSEGLAQITNWAAKGLTYAEIAKSMGVSEKTIYVWLDSHSEILQAIKKGREMSVVSLENMAFRLALGDVTEEVAVKVKDANGNERIEMRQRRPLPDRTMLIFLLKNRAGYSDNPNAQAAEAQQAPVFVFDTSCHAKPSDR